MTRKKMILGSAALLCVAAVLQVGVGDDGLPKAGAVKGSRASEPSKAHSVASPNQKEKDSSAATEAASESELDLPAADRDAILSTADTFVAAYRQGDAKAIASLFSSSAEYVDEQGYRFVGRAAIERAFAACLSEHHGAQMEMTIHSIRMVAPGVAFEDGTTIVASEKLSMGPIETDYTATHVKADGKWRTVSVRERTPIGRREHKTYLRQLSWLLGDWVDEGEDTLVMSSCQPIQGGNFLRRDFKLHLGGQEIVSGEQRIGWDPTTGKFKSWVFDSDGGYSEGFWQHDGNRWILKSVGVSTDGQPASCTTIYTIINENTMTWQTVGHEVAGVKIPDSDETTIVRRAPSPVVEGDHRTTSAR